MQPRKPYDSFSFLEPWTRIENYAGNFDDELRREVSPGHLLHSRAIRAIARRTDRDDVLFEVEAPDFRFAVVHLSWAGSEAQHPDWPAAQAFTTFEEWVATRMDRDHEEFMKER